MVNIFFTINSILHLSIVSDFIGMVVSRCLYYKQMLSQFENKFKIYDKFKKVPFTKIPENKDLNKTFNTIYKKQLKVSTKRILYAVKTLSLVIYKIFSGPN